MKTEKVFVEPEGHKEARDRHNETQFCVHVSRVQTIYLSFIFVYMFCLKY